MTVQIFSLETVDSPTGRMRIITDDEGRLLSVDWDDHESRMMKLLDGTAERILSPFERVGRRRRERGHWRGISMARFLRSPPCRRGPTAQNSNAKIWEALRTIPVGHSISYGALAARIGRPGASRAVGLANGRQSHRHRGALSPRDRRRLVADRLWRWSRAQAMAACA